MSKSLCRYKGTDTFQNTLQTKNQTMNKGHHQVLCTVENFKKAVKKCVDLLRAPVDLERVVEGWSTI